MRSNKADPMDDKKLHAREVFRYLLKNGVHSQEMINDLFYAANKYHLNIFGRMIVDTDFVAGKRGPISVVINNFCLEICFGVNPDIWADVRMEDAGEICFYSEHIPDMDYFSKSETQTFEKFFELLHEYGEGMIRGMALDKAFSSTETGHIIELEKIVDTLPEADLVREYLRR